MRSGWAVLLLLLSVAAGGCEGSPRGGGQRLVTFDDGTYFLKGDGGSKVYGKSWSIGSSSAIAATAGRWKGSAEVVALLTPTADPERSAPIRPAEWDDTGSNEVHHERTGDAVVPDGATVCERLQAVCATLTTELAASLGGGVDEDDIECIYAESKRVDSCLSMASAAVPIYAAGAYKVEKLDTASNTRTLRGFHLANPGTGSRPSQKLFHLVEGSSPDTDRPPLGQDCHSDCRTVLSPAAASLPTEFNCSFGKRPGKFFSAAKAGNGAEGRGTRVRFDSSRTCTDVFPDS